MLVARQKNFWILIYLLNIARVWSLDLLRIQIINDTPEMLVNFKANLTFGIAQDVPALINPNEVGLFSAKHSSSTSTQIKGFLSFSMPGPISLPFIVGWLWNESPIDFKVGIAGNDNNTLYIQNSLSVDSFLSLYKLDYSQDWIFKGMVSGYAVKMLIKPGAVTIHLFLYPLTTLKDNAYYYITNAKNSTYVMDANQNWKTTREQFKAFQSLNQGKQSQQFLIRQVVKPSSITATGNVYIILDRNHSLALTISPTSGLLTMDPLKGTQSSDYMSQLWFIENVFDMRYKVFTLKSASTQANVITNSDGDLWSVGNPATNYNYNYKLYFDYVNPYSDFIDNQIYLIKQWRNSSMATDLWSDLILKQYVENVYMVQQFRFKQTDCQGKIAYQLTEQGFGNSIIIDNTGQLKGATITTPQSREKWILLPSSEHYNSIYRIKNCGTGEFLKSPIDSSQGSNYTLSATADSNGTLFIIQKLYT